MKKKKPKSKAEHLIGSGPSYDQHPEYEGVVSKNNFDFLQLMAKATLDELETEWADNIKYNKKFWNKCAPLRSCINLCKDKAVVGIGAGQSFNKNKEHVKYYVNRDSLDHPNWIDRDFVTISANHQYKPLLEMGIIPDFVLLVDASDVVLDQLTKDIPSYGQHTVLITGVHCSPKVVEAWVNSGRTILFYLTPAKSLCDEFQKQIGKNPMHYKVELGGNVLNGAWVISAAIFQSTVFLSVGNDLSYPIKDTVEEQRNLYYADGDYSSNAEGTGTGRDEAGAKKRWAGIKEITNAKILYPGQELRGLDRYNIVLDKVGTSHTLWVYKNWLETTILSQAQHNARFNYFNCSEGGILGVMAKKDDDESLQDINNWYLFDTVAKNVHTGATMYHTAIFRDAAEFF